MKIYGVNLAEGSEIVNLTVATGSAFPSNANIGELFFRTDSPNVGLYIHDGSAWSEVLTGASVTPGGSDTHIQFNDSGNFGGDADLVWNKTTNVLTVTGKIIAQDPTASSHTATKNYTDNTAMAMAIVFG